MLSLNGFEYSSFKFLIDVPVFIFLKKLGPEFPSPHRNLLIHIWKHLF